MNVVDRIGQEKIIAIIRLDDLSEAVAIAKALLEGGVTVIEFTLTNPDAAQAITTVRDALGDDVIVGAGSVITAVQVTEVARAGAQFVVSPVTKYEVLAACKNHALPTMPGAYTPTEIQAVWEMDVAAVKVFPAGGLGSKYIKDVLAPLPHLRLIPTGGVNVQNIAEFVQAGVFAVGIGGALCNKRVIALKDWAKLSASAAALIEAIS